MFCLLESAVFFVWAVIGIFIRFLLFVQFSRLLVNLLASSRHVTMSINECIRLETCLLGLLESQSFFSWAMASVVAFVIRWGFGF